MPVNAEQFLRELDADVDALFREDVPAAVVDLALSIRQDAEDNTKRGPTGALEGGWMVGPVVPVAKKDPTEEPGGEEASRAAIATWKPGDSLFIYNNVFYGYFKEFGTIHQAPDPMLQPALQRHADAEIRL